MGRFKKHKFISKEKLAKSFKNEQWDDISIAFIDSVLEIRNFYKTGYAQYSLIDVQEREIYIVTAIKTELGVIKEYTRHYFDTPLKLKDISDIDGFEFLRQFETKGKVKPIYKLKSRATGEVLDCNVECIPDGYLDAEFVGILVK